jgi:hypothetical protein
LEIEAMSEVEFCGYCPREQSLNKGEQCISCGKSTIRWDKSRYPDRQWAINQWKEMRKFYGNN